MKPVNVNVAYASISGSGNQIDMGNSATLSLNTNIIGDVTWSVSDEDIASITAEGTVLAKKSGEFTVFANVDGFTTSRTFTVPAYKLTGTASWGNDSNRPADSADYTQAADGDLSTFFDGTQNGWVQYDYGTPFKVSEIKLAARDGHTDRTVGGSVQGSNDAITWTDLYKITSEIPSGQYTTIKASGLANNSAYRYYRYTNNSAMANIAEFLIDGEASNEIPANDPVVRDIEGFTDNFESDANIFGASNGAMSDGGNVVFASGLERFGNVFAPVKATAAAVLSKTETLAENDKFRLTFNMFAGWEDKGKENTFVLKDADGKELAALKMTGGGYNFNEIRIGGSNVLTAPTVAQGRSNPGTKKSGANGWDNADQPYRNTVGYNKTVEIIIDGTGNVSVSATGGMEDTTVTAKLTSSVTLGSIELTGDYNSAPGRTVSYDNFDGDIITYTNAEE